MHNNNMNTVPPLDTHRLTRLYIIALSMVALLSIIGQGLVQFSLYQQSNDSRIINIAGRQRMLSQRLSKAALASSATADPATRQLGWPSCRPCWPCGNVRTGACSKAMPNSPCPLTPTAQRSRACTR